jgi:hypothetical protein
MSSPPPLFQGAKQLAYALNHHLLARLDRVFLARHPTPPPPPLFIVGVPRSGTTLAYQIITQQIQVGYLIDTHNLFFGCPNLLTRLVAPFVGRPYPVFESTYGKTDYRFAPAESGVFWLRWFPADNVLGHYVPPATVNSEDYVTLRSNLESLAHILHKPMIFKSVYLSLAIGALAQLLPDALFIFVERDLLLNCQSMLIARQKQGDSWWSVRPPYYQQWLDYPLWQQVTRQVFVTHQVLRRDLQQYAPSRYYHVSYRALCQQPHQFVRELTAWLAPYGYQSYADWQIPAKFTISTQWKLGEDIRQLIQTELNKLEREGTHS